MFSIFNRSFFLVNKQQYFGIVCFNRKKMVLSYVLLRCIMVLHVLRVLYIKPFLLSDISSVLAVSC